ncbi:RNA polymerase II C-terminal domain phosphatase-like 4 [Papaver somniferum]|uniref:RNA polymerase II C-terminal domain phosphatase-like 4 n=1 Tax=Papaver somniferum TaxID=3469 RepID=UPI000E6F6796|nr:RNA polymerase II C-terminal domain phosphatase-like 4 [Papaver somniferum]
METTSNLCYEDLIKQEDRILKRRSCNRNINRRLVGFRRIFGNTYKRCFVEKNKLCLVLDLDHTLLHSVNVCDVSKDGQDYLNKKAVVVSSNNDIKGLGSSGDNLYNYRGIYTKLRPHTREFLEQLSDKFELFVYTLGTRDYAQNMGRLLDPEGVLFNSMVSRDDSTFEDRKNLDILAGPDEKNTIIIDDNKYVWKEHKNNLIEIDEYKFFTKENGGHILNKGEKDAGFDDKDESLKPFSELLQRVHKKFFELFPVPKTDVELQEYIKSVDVRPILKTCRKNKSGRKGEESNQVLPNRIGGADLSEVPRDNRVEDLRKEENRVQDADKTCDQERSKESELETDSENKISSDEGIATGKVKSLETILSRFSVSCVQIMDKLLKATSFLEVSNGGTAVDMRAFAVAYRHS